MNHPLHQSWQNQIIASISISRLKIKVMLVLIIIFMQVLNRFLVRTFVNWFNPKATATAPVVAQA